MHKYFVLGGWPPQHCQGSGVGAHSFAGLRMNGSHTIARALTLKLRSELGTCGKMKTAANQEKVE